MRRSTFRRSVIASGAALVLAGTLTPLAGTAAAEPAAAAVLAPYGSWFSPEYLKVVGRTGFLHKAGDMDHYLWTEYATGRSTPFTVPEGSGSVINTHADTVAYRTGTAGDVTLADPVAGTSRTVRLPAGFSLHTVVGDTIVAYTSDECHLLRAGDDGALTDRVVSLPEGASCHGGGAGDVQGSTGDGHAVAVFYSTATEGRYGLIDLDTARLTPLPTPPNLLPRGLQVSPQAVAWYDDEAKAIRVVPRDGSGQPWSAPATYSSRFGLVGSRLLRIDGNNKPVTLLSADGSSTQVLDLGYDARTGFVPGPDGSMMVFGRKTAGGDYAVHRFTESSDGALREDVVVTAPWNPSRTDSLALVQGRLATVDTYGANSSLHERKLALTGVPEPVTKEAIGAYGACAPQGCPTLYPTGDGRVLYQQDSSTLRLVDKAKPTPGTTLALGAPATVLGVSGRSVAYRTASAIEVRDLDTRAIARRLPLSPAAGLWGSTLWRADGTGKVTSTDVAGSATTRTLSLGVSCALGSIQVSARHLYWECASVADGAGVVTLADGKVRKLSVAGHGVLGDGFVTYVGADRAVRVVDLTATTPATRTLGTARGAVAGRDFTADPTGDRVAFVDADDNVHVVPTGVGASALAQTDAAVPASARVVIEGAAWRPRWWFSKPVASWTMTLKNKVTGKTVRTLSGGEARGLITPAWDGSLGQVTPGAADGSYSWTLTVRPADGQGPALTKSGTVAITGAQPALHDMVGRDRAGDLLTMNSSGAFTYQHGTGEGTFSGKTSSGGWPTATIAVPFGDVDLDDMNETLVRTATGELRSYRTGAGALRPTTPYVKLGTGWTTYDSLTTSGDLTGDGRPDLLGRKKSTGDIYVWAGKSDGTLEAGRKIRSAWTAYTHILGVGDLNGDGIGEILARHKDGTLYRYDGKGDGTLKDRVAVFTKWGAEYNTIVGVGDITGDGRNDLVERDTAGNLYRNDGKGNGSFTGRTKITSGWQGYKGVF